MARRENQAGSLFANGAQTTSFLKLRWFVGTAFLIVPVAFTEYRAVHFRSAPLPHDAPVHVAIAWAVGALMSFLADTYRRSVTCLQRCKNLRDRADSEHAGAEVELHVELCRVAQSRPARLRSGSLNTHSPQR